MTRKLIILILIWLSYVVTDYYLLPYFVQPFTWLLVSLLLLVLTIRQLVKIIKQRNDLKLYRVINLSIIIILFGLTFYGFNKIPNSAIEKVDWLIFYKKRNQIVSQVEAGKLKSNTELNNGICRLPFSFPIISNGGNDIWINTKTKIIKFWISRGFFESPQKYFIYTNDIETKKYYLELIKEDPKYNWQLEENWFRIMERN